MKKQFLLITLLLLIITTKAQQVQNPGFENWVSGFPQNWGSYSQSIVNNGKPNPHLEAQTSMAHSGSYAIVMQNTALATAGGNNVPGGICTCPITFNGGPILGFGPYSSLPISYDFWYQFNAVNGDNAITQVYITKWNTGTNKRDTLASGGSLITGPVSVYTNLSVPITWLITGQAPDSMQLSFTSSTKAVGNGIPTGGMLYIDDVNMNFSATGLETFNTATFNVFPNPANNKITIQASAELGIITIYNCLGEIVMQTKSLNNKEQVDISKFSAGIYTIQTQNRFIKLIKQ